MPCYAKTKVGARICSEFVPQLKASSFYEIDFSPRFESLLKEFSERRIVQIICYGLGSFYSGVSLAPRYQLALLLLMHERVSEFGAGELSDTIEIFDPRFKERDIAILNSFEHPKFQLIEQDELCARKLEETTLVFMPHLHCNLYHNIIGANWAPANLDKLILVGNSFRIMIRQHSYLFTRGELHYLDLLVNNFVVKDKKREQPLFSDTSDDDIDRQRHKALIEMSIDTPDKDQRNYFNEMSIHFINPDWLKENKNKIKKNKLKKWVPVADTANSDKEDEDDDDMIDIQLVYDDETG